MSREDLVLERRFVAAFGKLLQELGMGRRRADGGLLALIEQATVEIRRLKEALQKSRDMPAQPSPDYDSMRAALEKYRQQHLVQFRALDLDDQVHLRGEWTPEVDALLSRSKLQNEMTALQAAGYDLRIVKYQQCTHLNLTKVAQEEAPPF